jgi:3-oxoacyl-[acyl-carrier protein] reductase
MVLTSDSNGGGSSPHVDLPLLGKAGIVTGAGTGIGSAIARQISDLGADVGINFYMSEEGARKIEKEVKDKGRRALLLQADVSKPDQVQRIVDKAVSEFGRIDFLVNNATGSHAKTDNSVENAILEDWNLEIGVDLTGAFLCTRYAAPLMLKKKRGKIVNISSICALTGDCGPAYCAAKAGLLGLTRACAVALAPYVQVNAILPGFVSSQSHDPALVAKITPGAKMGTPEDIAELVGDIISTKGTFLTGSCITIDGAVTEGNIGLSMGWIKQRD